VSATDPEALRALALDLQRHLAWQEENGLQRLSRDPAVYAALVPPTEQAAAALAPSAPVIHAASAALRVAVEEEAAGPASSPNATRPTLESIRADLGDCQRCKLCSGRKNIVFGVGNPDAELVFVGEGPGANEDAQGIPFVGEAGELLTKMIVAMGFSREQVYICNVVKCRPPGNRNPEPDEIEACEPFLKAQLAALRPKAIVALGKFAAQTLLKDTTAISRLRGTWREYEGVPLMPTFHPAYLLRNPAEKRSVWADLQKVMARFAEAKR
jgi:DNA polymerase